jgi:hypothetical protein
MKRYVGDLISSLKDAGVNLTHSAVEGSVVHAVSPVFFARGSPFVVSVGDLAPMTKGNAEWVDYGSLSTKLYQRYFSQIVTRSFNHADAIISLSTQTTKEVSQVFPHLAEKVRTINPGIADRFRPLERPAHEDVQIGYYRELSPLMQKVVGLLKGRGVRFSLRSLSGVADEKIVEYYNSIDYFIDFMPYRGFGYPLVEACACGTTVLLRKDAKVPDEVKSMALLVEDEYDAADKVEKRVTRPFQPVPFTIPKMASQTIAVYDDLLSKG